MQGGDQVALALCLESAVVDGRTRARHDAVMGLGLFRTDRLQRSLAGQTDDLRGAALATASGSVLLQRDQMDMGVAWAVVMDGSDPRGCPMRELVREVPHQCLMLVAASLSGQGDDETFGDAPVSARHRLVPFGQLCQAGAVERGEGVSLTHQDSIRASAADIAQPRRCPADPVRGRNAAVPQRIQGHGSWLPGPARENRRFSLKCALRFLSVSLSHGGGIA